MMADVTKIYEPVQVLAVFACNRIKPKAFIWNGRKYNITDVTCTWKSDRGVARVYHFAAVTNAANTYELSFNSESLGWMLDRVCYD